MYIPRPDLDGIAFPCPEDRVRAFEEQRRRELQALYQEYLDLHERVGRKLSKNAGDASPMRERWHVNVEKEAPVNVDRIMCRLRERGYGTRLLCERHLEIFIPNDTIPREDPDAIDKIPKAAANAYWIAQRANAVFSEFIGKINRILMSYPEHFVRVATPVSDVVWKTVSRWLKDVYQEQGFETRETIQYIDDRQIRELLIAWPDKAVKT
ncbi:MAG: hypothetical protein KDK78_08825 [Chlamydiia bacterium]|nr:hypothetical protein [Chlamydiia bacterium]